MLLLTVYILIDFYRKRKDNLLRRLVFYSFLFYVLNVLHQALGGIFIPPLPTDGYQGPLRLFQPYPFYFVWDFVRMLDYGLGPAFRIVRPSFYNLLFLAPLGFYLPCLFRVKSVMQVALIAFLVSLMIESAQLLTTVTGLVMRRSFNVDDLLLNTLGAVLVFVFYPRVSEWIFGDHWRL
ncbi:MAG: VanZ family protein [Firmicutes bacterium]|nr:VanZ family protein [Bacillota bacterium]